MINAERQSIAEQLDPPFEVQCPTGDSGPVIFCSPHSGRIYPRAFLAASRLRGLMLRKSEDCYVDELFAAAPRLGAPLIAARFPRAYVDVNREPFELDPELFAEPIPAFANAQSVRVTGGLGTIPRIVADGEEIYAQRLPLAIGYERIERLYQPFHAALAGLIEAARARYGFAVLVDCHSMPSTILGHPHMARPHFVLGDRFGASCDARLTRMLRSSMAALGYDVHLNRPYAGGFITEHYGNPKQAVHAIQIEINRALYLDEETLEKRPGFGKLTLALDRVVGKLLADASALAAPPLAAE